MSIHNPPRKWLKAPHGYELMWIGVALLWCLVLSAAMPYWHLKGKQTSAGEAYDVDPKEFEARVARFVKAHKVGEMNGVPVVEPPPGTDAYIFATDDWQWYPALKLKKDVEYRLHLSSSRYQHGFCILPMNMNFHVLPAYDHVITLTPTETGEFTIICNEFCGAGHATMTGMIIVEE